MNTINPVQPKDTTIGTTSSSSGLPGSQQLNNMFLQLLVAQLQNQDPLNPMDPTQFVGQLAQFSELSEVTQIDQTLQQLASPATTGTAASILNHQIQGVF
jgi:flagellar basal-body rod modification protein FlgD